MALDLSVIPLIDSHCHGLQRRFSQLDSEAFLAHFTEATDRDQILHHVPSSLFWHGAQRVLGARLNCDADLTTILEARRTLPPAKLLTSLLHDQGYRAMLVDHAYPPDGLPFDELQALLAPRLYEIVRIESVAEELLPSVASLDEFRRAFQETLYAAADRGALAFKSIIAYRCGLSVEPVSESSVRSAFKRERAAAQRDGQARLSEAALLGMLLVCALEVASEYGLPFQFHTGFGDADLDLRLANPLALRPLICNDAYASVPIVLLHAGYPFCRQAAYLASTYSQVYIDCSLAIPFLHTGIESLLAELLELAPFTKLLFGSDAHGIPEHWLLAARWARRALTEVLVNYVERGWLTEHEATAAAERFLWRNAAALYRLPETP